MKNYKPFFNICQQIVQWTLASIQTKKKNHINIVLIKQVKATQLIYFFHLLEMKLLK